MAEPSTRIPAHEVEPVAISDGHALANGGTLPGSGPTPTPAAASLPGGRAYADASGSAPRLREEGAEATNPALTELAAVVTDGGTPADGGSRKGADLIKPSYVKKEIRTQERKNTSLENLTNVDGLSRDVLASSRVP